MPFNYEVLHFSLTNSWVVVQTSLQGITGYLSNRTKKFVHDRTCLLDHDNLFPTKEEAEDALRNYMLSHHGQSDSPSVKTSISNSFTVGLAQDPDSLATTMNIATYSCKFEITDITLIDLKEMVRAIQDYIILKENQHET